MSVNVEATMNAGRSEYVNAGQLSDSSSVRNEPYNNELVMTGIAFLMHISLVVLFL